MHSATLRGADFVLRWRGALVPHAEFFAAVHATARIGVVIPQRLDALGAITLIMAYVTAFYDRYRERGGDFFAYPDYFTFQRASPCADYGMCDIWPPHKQVLVPADAQRTLEAVTDRGVNVLLVPDGEGRDSRLAPVERESARRSIVRCFAYSASGHAAQGDLIIACARRLLREYALAVCDSAPADDPLQMLRQPWLTPDGDVAQSFREVTLDEALRLM